MLRRPLVLDLPLGWQQATAPLGGVPLATNWRLYVLYKRNDSAVRLVKYVYGVKFFIHILILTVKPLIHDAQRMTSMDWAKTTSRWNEKHLVFMILCALYYIFDGNTERFSHILHNYFAGGGAILQYYVWLRHQFKLPTWRNKSSKLRT